MARKEADLTTCMITQQLDPDFFSWTDDEKKVLSQGAHAIADLICKKLYAAGMAVAEAHCIIHNKDMREVWDTTENRYVLEQKPEHFHIVLKFFRDEEGKVYGGTPTKIANAVGVSPEYIEKPRRGKFAYDNMLSYLIHIKYADKAQYEPTEVVTVGCDKDGTPLYQSFQDYYKERKREWLDGRAKIKAEQAKVSIEILEEKILTGEVCKNQILLTDEYYDIYARNKRRCDDAFDSYAQRKIARTIQAMENGEFKVTVFFVTGSSHSGKSVFTDNLVKQIQRDAKQQLGMEWSVCSVAAQNPFDEYLGEEILVMDDLRGISLTASDWLKLLDPDRINTGSARYRNKKMACRTIIINSEKDVIEFFYYLKNSGGGDRSEALDQFFRRIMARVKVYRVPDNLDVRRIEVGEMQETNRYLVAEPGVPETPYGTKTLALHHDFDKNLQDMEYDDAKEYLSALVMERNMTNEVKGQGEAETP